MNKKRLLTVLGGSKRPWYLAGDVDPSNIVAAYQPVLASNYAASKINVANPGTHDLSDGTAFPAHSSRNGWEFTGSSSQYLVSDIVPSGDQTWSAIIRFTNGLSNANGYIPLMVDHDTGKMFNIVGDWSNLGRLYSSGSKSVYDNTLRKRTGAGILAIAGKQTYKDGATDMLLADGTATITNPINIGVYTTEFLTGNIQYLIIYNTTLTTAQVLAITNEMNKKDAIMNLVFDGDSLTEGAYSTAGYDYPSVLSSNYPSYTKYNLGIGGAKVSEMIANFKDVDAAYATKKSILCLLGGHNDLNNAVTGANLYTSVTTYHTMAKATGYKTIAMTVFSSALLTAGEETQRLDFNSRLSADHSFADGFVDLAADARLQNPADTTYFNADGVHLTDAGYAVIAALVKPVLDTLV